MGEKKKSRGRDNSVFALFFIIGLLSFIILLQLLVIISLVKQNQELTTQLAKYKSLVVTEKITERFQKPRRKKTKISFKHRKLVNVGAIKLKKKRFESQKISQKIKPRLAIILDDWGYSKQNFHYLREISLPIDVSVLPDHDFSKEAAQLAHKTGKEVMLHLPMQPVELEATHWEKSTITVDMQDEEIRKVIKQALEAIPYVVGANNHMGSKATTDERVMTIVLTEFKKRGLFFIDSVSSPKTVVLRVGKKIGIRLGRRDVFLDNNPDIEYIKSQLRLAIRIAQQKGTAIAIGHDRPNTLKAVAEMETELLDKVDVVPVSRIVR